MCFFPIFLMTSWLRNAYTVFLIALVWILFKLRDVDCFSTDKKNDIRLFLNMFSDFNFNFNRDLRSKVKKKINIILKSSIFDMGNQYPILFWIWIASIIFFLTFVPFLSISILSLTITIDLDLNKWINKMIHINWSNICVISTNNNNIVNTQSTNDFETLSAIWKIQHIFSKIEEWYFHPIH